MLQIIVHEEWDRVNNYNDIALYKTDRPIRYRIDEKSRQFIVNNICLPDPGQDDFPYEAVIAGWGRPDADEKEVAILRKGFVPIFPWVQCKENYKRIGDIDKNMVCYGGEGDVDSCMVSQFSKKQWLSS